MSVAVKNNSGQGQQYSRMKMLLRKKNACSIKKLKDQGRVCEGLAKSIKEKQKVFQKLMQGKSQTINEKPTDVLALKEQQSQIAKAVKLKAETIKLLKDLRIEQKNCSMALKEHRAIEASKNKVDSQLLFLANKVKFQVQSLDQESVIDNFVARNLEASGLEIEAREIATLPAENIIPEISDVNVYNDFQVLRNKESSASLSMSSGQGERFQNMMTEMKHIKGIRELAVDSSANQNSIKCAVTLENGQSVDLYITEGADQAVTARLILTKAIADRELGKMLKKIKVVAGMAGYEKFEIDAAFSFE